MRKEDATHRLTRPQVAVPKPSLALVGAALLGVCALSVAVEFVQDWARRRALQKSGQYEAWQAKATAVADAVRGLVAVVG